MENSIFADMKEIWNKVKNYENYEVSNLGGVRSLNYRGRGFMKILKCWKNKSGYLYITLVKEKSKKSFRLHRLIWETFNGEIPEGMQVNRIDENKENNRLDNLNLMTPKENVNWGTRNQRASNKKYGIKRPDVICSKSVAVLQFSLDGELVREWSSMAEAGRNGFDQPNISACCRGKLKTHKNYIWKYKCTNS